MKRTRKKKENAKDDRIILRVSKARKDEIITNAKKENMTLSKYILNCVFSIEFYNNYIKVIKDEEEEKAKAKASKQKNKNGKL